MEEVVIEAGGEMVTNFEWALHGIATSSVLYSIRELELELWLDAYEPVEYKKL